MKGFRTGIVAAAAASGVLLSTSGCGSDRMSGGNGTSTDNVVTARTFSIDSLARNAADGDGGAYPLLVGLDSTLLDLSRVRPDGHGLVVERTDSHELSFDVREWSGPARRGSIWIRIPRYVRGQGDRIRIRETSDTANHANHAAVWRDVSEYTKLQVASIPLTDFAGMGLKTPTPCGCNYWYAQTSAAAVFRPASTVYNLGSALGPAGFGRPGAALRAAYSIGKLGEWALIGTHLGLGTHDFSGLDSITFWARGNGTLHVALEDGTDSTSRSKAWATVEADTGWSRFVVLPTQFETASPWNKSWKEVQGHVNTFTIFFEAGTEVWIDDIRLHGIAPQDLM